MKRLLAGLLLSVVMGCAPDAPPPVVVAVQSYRDQNAQIASQTDVTPARMAGNWHIRQRFAGLSAMGDEIRLSVLPNGALQLALPMTLCLDGTCTDGPETLVLLEPTGPGRWTPVNAPAALFDAEIWVMWMDFDSRTATLGTPSGEFGWIMDKNPTGGRDRIIAARDIMDWFGYDVSRLEEVE